MKVHKGRRPPADIPGHTWEPLRRKANGEVIKWGSRPIPPPQGNR